MKTRTLRHLAAFALIAIFVATGLIATPGAASASTDSGTSQAVQFAQYACTYKVQYGDTLYSIALRYHTTVWELVRLNGLNFWGWIYAGQTLRVPCGNDGGSDNPGCTYRANYVADITVPDGAMVIAGAHFNKVWRVRNSGTCTWGPGHALHSLTWVGGTQMGAPATVNFNTVVYPGREVDLSVPMVAPTMSGRYLSEWKLKVDGGPLVGMGWTGAPLYVDFNVSVYEVRNGGRIQFAPGTDSLIVNDTTSHRQAVRYVAGARAGQTMSLNLLGIVPTPAVLILEGADGTLYLPSSYGHTSYTLTLPKTQDYFITVEPTTDATVNFALQVTIR